MKKHLFGISLLLAWSLILFSCSKKDDDTSDPDSNPPESYFTYDGKTYELTQAYQEFLGPVGGPPWHIDLALMTKEYSVQIENDVIQKVDGSGTMVFFSLMSSASDDITPGTYTYNSAATSAGTYYSAVLGIDFNQLTFSGTIYQITSGSFLVSKSESGIYTVVFSLKDENQKLIEGEYKGSIPWYDGTW